MSKKVKRDLISLEKISNSKAMRYVKAGMLTLSMDSFIKGSIDST